MLKLRIGVQNRHWHFDNKTLESTRTEMQSGLFCLAWNIQEEEVEEKLEWNMASFQTSQVFALGRMHLELQWKICQSVQNCYSHLSLPFKDTGTQNETLTKMFPNEAK